MRGERAGRGVRAHTSLLRGGLEAVGGVLCVSGLSGLDPGLGMRGMVSDPT